MQFHFLRFISISLFYLSLCVNGLQAQTPHAPGELTIEDYQKGEKALRQQTSRLVFNDNVRPNWIDGHRFWYRNRTPEGTTFILVNAKNKTKGKAFNPKKLAAALSKEMNEKIDANSLPFRSIEFLDDGEHISFSIKFVSYKYSPGSGKLTKLTAPDSKLRKPPYASVSPNGKKAVYIKNYNLWMKNLESGLETQLTTDGIEDFGYATNNAGWTKGKSPVLLWSPDSKKIATFQHDARGVGKMYVVRTQEGHPQLRQWKYPLPGDSLIFRIERVVIHVGEARLVRLKMDPDQHRSSVTDHVAVSRSQLADAQWSADSKQLAFLSSSRDHKEAWLRIANPETGEVREILDEKVKTFFESGSNTHNWRVLTTTNEVIWYSQRADWANLYLYDLKTGKLKNPITTGNWNVYRILNVDEKERSIYFYGMGKEAGDPYYRYCYRVNFDGTGLQLLSPGNANHFVDFSPSGDYFVDNYSTPDKPPVSVLRNKKGQLVLELEKADISKLLATGWQPPMSFSVKARDGVTDLYGLLYKPVDFDENKKYPIINYIYPGPQAGSVGSRNFSTARRDNQALANLGFIVVALDAMGHSQSLQVISRSLLRQHG